MGCEGPGEGFRPAALNKAGEGQAWLEEAGTGRPQSDRGLVGSDGPAREGGYVPTEPNAALQLEKLLRIDALGWAKGAFGARLGSPVEGPGTS